MKQEMSEVKENELPKFIKLKKDKYKKYGVNPNVTGEYKMEGKFYNNVIQTPNLFAPTFSINILLHHSDDFEIIEK